LIIAREVQLTASCEVRSDVRNLLAASEAACRPPDAGDERVMGAIPGCEDFEPQSLAAVAALVLATGAEGEERAALLARAREHATGAAGTPGATRRLDTLTERAIVRVMVAIADGQENPEALLRDPNLERPALDAEFIRGEARRARGRKGSAREHYLFAITTDRTCSSRFISAVIHHDFEIARPLHDANDDTAPEKARADARRHLSTMQPACLPWIRADVQRVLSSK